MTRLASSTKLLACALLILAANVASIRAQTSTATDKKDIFIRCSVRVGATYAIPESKFQALADNLADSDFADFDPECLGKKLNPKGVARSLKKRQAAANRIADDLRDAAAARSNIPGAMKGAVPADVARTSFGKDKAPTLPVLFRDAYSTYSLLSPPPPRERATGTQVSYTRDLANDNSVISAKGAIIAWNTTAIASGSDHPLAPFGVTRTLWAPGIEFDQSRNRKDPKKDVDYLGFKFMTEFERETAGGAFPLQFFRTAAYFKTDSKGDSRIGGGYFEWEPYNLYLAIGVARRLFDSPLQFRWAPIVRAEAEHVFDAGRLTGIQTGDTYFRIGPVLQADIFFADGPLRNLVLGAQYRYLSNLATTGSANDISYFQTTATYNLDDAGYAGLSVTYREGDLPGNGTRVRDVKTGLTVKY